MTTQAQLLDIAQKHVDNPTVRTLLASLAEARYLAQFNLDQASSLVDIRRRALAGQEGFTVPLDSSDLVTAAAKASAALTRMAYDYLTLASALTSLGEDINY